MKIDGNEILILQETLPGNKYIQVENLTELRIAEFNYKLLQSILNNNVSVSKLNKDVSPLCEICKTEEDTRHLLYECKIVKPI